MRKLVIHTKDNVEMKATKSYSNNVLKLIIKQNGDNVKTLRVP